MKIFFSRSFALFASCFCVLSANAERVSSDLQAEIIRFYSENHCDQVRALESRINLNELRPNVLAIYASCEPANQDPEKLFQLAESKNPTGDLILVLHGRYRYQKDPKSSAEIWQKVELLARNQYFRELANSYLSNLISVEDNQKPLDLSPTTLFTRVMAGGVYRSHANSNLFSFAPTDSAFGVTARGDFRFRHWTPWGSGSCFLSAESEQYNRFQEYNYLKTSIEIPVAIHVAATKDLIFRPIFKYSTLGGDPFNFVYGVAMKAAVYKTDYVQSVQAVIFAERIFNLILQPEQGAHYRFEYSWDFYPRYWTIMTQFAIEHVSSSTVSQYLGHFGSFELSHNDLNLTFKFQRDYSRFSLSLEPALWAHLDTQPSQYSINSPPFQVSEGREDLELRVRSDVSVPISPSVMIDAWYEWDRIYSNLGSMDYVDRNWMNQTFGLALKTSFSSY